MPEPMFLGLSSSLLKKHRLREYYDAVDLAVGGKTRMVLEINKSSEAYWKFQANRARLEPKDVTLTVDNRAEALLATYEAEQRGEVIEFAEDRRITVEDAQFTEVSEQVSLWPEAVFDGDDD